MKAPRRKSANLVSVRMRDVEEAILGDDPIEPDDEVIEPDEEQDDGGSGLIAVQKAPIAYSLTREVTRDPRTMDPLWYSNITRAIVESARRGTVLVHSNEQKKAAETIARAMGKSKIDFRVVKAKPIAITEHILTDCPKDKRINA